MYRGTNNREEETGLGWGGLVPTAEERRAEKRELAATTANKPSVVICQNIVEDMLNHLIREKLLTRSQCMSVRDTFVGIVVGKLTHVG
jgi:hypothetical protein